MPSRRRRRVLSFDEQEDELARDPAIALTEYAPGNFVYYRGARYEITHGRPRTRGENLLAFEKVLICPECGTAYLGAGRPSALPVPAAADSFTGVHPIQRALQMPDMVAHRRTSHHRR